ncbi:MAG: beta-lactamase family protein, partial [Bacteroidia bacterium]|nr:beta-lactamase family protein [Bacteroidia bacterium]
PGYWVNPPDSDRETLELALDIPANFPPGEGYGYSNTNYLLLAMLMDKVLGHGHYQYIREKILIPLGLNNTYASLNEVNIEDVMSGYYVGYEEDLKTNEMGMIATAEDVGIFLRALNDGSLFEEGEQEIYSSIYEYNHTGLIPGYQSIAKYHPDLDAVVIQFTNTTDFEGYNWSLSEITYNRIIKILKRKSG